MNQLTPQRKPRQRRLWIGGVMLGLLAVLVVLAWWGLKRWRIEQAVEATRNALSAGKMEEAVFGIRWLSSHKAGHPLLPVFWAQFYSRTAPHLAPPFWEEALARYPDDLEFRTAYALNLVGIGELEKAESRVRGWLEEDPQASAHLRAALAVAFARSKIEWARDLAEQLEEIEPASKVNRINRATLELSAGEGEERTAALESLWTLLDDPEVGLEALRLLLHYAAAASDAGLFGQIKSRVERSGPEVDMLFLETAGVMGHEPDRGLVEGVWEKTEAGSLERSRLGGWLVNQGRSDWLIHLAGREPEEARWLFPVGLPLAEAHVQTRDVHAALEGLSEVEWPGLEYLRLFVRSRLAAHVSDQASKTFLDLALKKTGGRDPQWRHLFETARIWNWRDGMKAVVRSAIGNTPVNSPRFAFWAERATVLRDVEGLLLASERFLKEQPHHVPSLNNAAYCAFLLDRDLDQALGRARRAYKLSPRFAGLSSTLAFLEIVRGDPARGERLLAELPDNDPYRWLGQLYLIRKRGGTPSPDLLEAVGRHRYYWPEEERLKAELFKF